MQDTSAVFLGTQPQHLRDMREHVCTSQRRQVRLPGLSDAARLLRAFPVRRPRRAAFSHRPVVMMMMFYLVLEWDKGWAQEWAKASSLALGCWSMASIARVGEGRQDS